VLELEDELIEVDEKYGS